MTERLNSELEGERAKSRDLEEKLRVLEEVGQAVGVGGWGVKSGLYSRYIARWGGAWSLACFRLGVWSGFCFSLGVNLSWLVVS